MEYQILVTNLQRNVIQPEGRVKNTILEVNGLKSSNMTWVSGYAQFNPFDFHDRILWTIKTIIWQKTPTLPLSRK